MEPALNSLLLIAGLIALSVGLLYLKFGIDTIPIIYIVSKMGYLKIKIFFSSILIKCMKTVMKIYCYILAHILTIKQDPKRAFALITFPIIHPKLAYITYKMRRDFRKITPNNIEANKLMAEFIQKTIDERSNRDKPTQG